MHYEALQQLSRDRGERLAQEAHAERLARQARGRRQRRRRRLALAESLGSLRVGRRAPGLGA